MISPDKEIFRKYGDPEQFDRIVDMDSVSQMWQNSVKCYPDAVAVEDNGKRYTYSDIDAAVALYRTLIKRDDKKLRVGIYLSIIHI